MSDPILNESKSTKRNKVLVGFVLLVGIIGGGASVYWYEYASKFISTDNAYAAVEIAQVTPSVGGTISAILVNDTKEVKAGDLLVKIDEADTKIALAQAQADLQRAKADLQKGNAGLQAANAGLQAAHTEYEKTSIELSRRVGIVESGSVSKDELTTVQSAKESAKANMESAKSTIEAAKSGIEAAKSTIEAAKARVEQAKLDLSRTSIYAPIGGIVSKRQVQLGQRVQVGMPLLSIVPANKIHVDANFKEVQLQRVRVGQKATIYADLYGKDVVYHGVVEGFSGGSGAAFAAIPAQNATGNWIKVVQRVPVRIRLDEAELKVNPLKVGLSMNVEIDTSKNAN